MITIEYFKKGNGYYKEQNYNRAVEIYNKAIKNRDNEIAAMHNMALCYIKLKQYNKSIPLLKIAAEKDPSGIHFFNLAFAYLIIKDLRKALMYFNTAWSLSPGNKDCKIMIDYILKMYKKGGSVDKLV